MGQNYYSLFPFPCVTGGIFELCFACGQVTRPVLGAGTSASYCGAGVVGCEGHRAAMDTVG